MDHADPELTELLRDAGVTPTDVQPMEPDTFDGVMASFELLNNWVAGLDGEAYDEAAMALDNILANLCATDEQKERIAEVIGLSLPQ